MRAKTIRKALVVAPLSVLRNWENEAHRIIKPCVRNARIQVISSDTVKGHMRTRRLHEALESQSCQLVITSYGLVTTVPDDFKHKNRNCYWDYIILDEAVRLELLNPRSNIVNVDLIPSPPPPSFSYICSIASKIRQQRSA
jgi:SNF2 family DNA or RNA helicase